jgi:hypothetical protein
MKNPLSPSGLLAPGPTGLLAHPAHLAGLNPLARVWVGQTDPAQPSLAHLLFSSIPLWRLDRRRRRLSGLLRWTLPLPPWAKHAPLYPLLSPPSGIARRLLHEEIGVVLPLGICRLPSPPVGCFVEPPLLCGLNNLWCLRCTSTRRWVCSLFPLCTLCSPRWPWSLAMLTMISELSSQIPLCGTVWCKSCFS